MVAAALLILCGDPYMAQSRVSRSSRATRELPTFQPYQLIRLTIRLK